MIGETYNVPEASEVFLGKRFRIVILMRRKRRREAALLIWKRERCAVDNWVLRALIREVVHTLIVYQEDLSYFEDGNDDEDNE